MPEDIISIDEKGIIPYVSRGGLKLEKAIMDFDVDFMGKRVLDIGASTGGFTHCALEHGASAVWAIDVGTNQLDGTLRNNPKVISIENCDIRNLDPAAIGTRVDIVVADVSFISLTLILEYIPKFLAPNGLCILLIKPQFEAGPGHIGKGGIVKNKKVHVNIISNIAVKAQSSGLYMNALTSAPVSDPKKNIEYLGLFESNHRFNPDVTSIVNKAFGFK